MAIKNIINEICSRWSLPQEYIDFLCNHENNLYVDIDDDEIEVFGAKGLIEGQDGYSFNPITNAVITDWNANYVVIATCYGDPYCIDVSETNPSVYFAVHGEGEWKFEKDSETLEEFLQFLGI